MNKSDSERINSLLDSLKYKKVDSKDEADLIIFVACSVRQSAIDRIYGQSSALQNRRKKNGLKTILTGCITGFDKQNIVDKFDAILDIKDLPSWPDKLSKLFKITDKNLACNSYLSISPKYSSKFSAYVPIMNGCNNFCSYCVVPYTRGHEVSRPVNEIVAEVKDLISKGYKEIILIGQNVNSYAGELDFPDLLKKINDLKGDFWLRFVTSHPKDMSDKLIQAFGKCEKLTEYFHIALQSGNDEILRQMNRRYTTKHYFNLIKKIRRVIRKTRQGILKHPMISTDIIVGFPGETTEQFRDTAKLMKKIKFDMAYIARYSTRPGTMAEKMDDNVSNAEKIRREKVLTSILKKTALKNNKRYKNKIVEILVEGKNKKTSQYYGKTRTFKNIRFESDKNLIGQFVKIKITQVGTWGLEGKIEL